MFSQFNSSEFEKNKSKSRFIHQYKCRCSPKRWWGSATSNTCNKYENYPSFIVPGDKADKSEKTDKKSHYCAACEGVGHCSVVAKVLNSIGHSRKG